MEQHSPPERSLSHICHDRRDSAAGAMLGQAYGDALGAPYEFLSSPNIILRGDASDMVGGGAFNWERGEWTDDTAMAVPILQGIATGKNILDAEVQDEIARQWSIWRRQTKDIGASIQHVISHSEENTALSFSTTARRLNASSPSQSGGNGSLMRTSAVALAFHRDTKGKILVAQAAREIGAMTHADTLTNEAVILWTTALWDVIHTGRFSIRSSLVFIPRESHTFWKNLFFEAKFGIGIRPQTNGWSVMALKMALNAIEVGMKTKVPPGKQFESAMRHIINQGYDTDTVAAITGGMMGAMIGAKQLNPEWRKVIHGYPSMTADELSDMAMTAVSI